MLANLKTALAARRLRQADLAFELRVAPSLISEIVHGRRKAEPHLARRIAEILNADPAWLFVEVHFIPALKRDQAVENALAI